MFFRYILFLAGILWPLSAAAVCKVTDDAGQQIQLSKPAKHIVVLSPDLVEDLFAIGAGSQIAGVISGSDFPAKAKQLPQVGSYGGIDLERIALLHPDLIVTWRYTAPHQVAALRELQIPVFVAAPKKLADIPRLLRQLGCLTGREKQAASVAEQFTREIKRLAKQARHQHRLKVFLQIDSYALLTVNRNSWISEAVSLCGGKNIFDDAMTIAPEVSREAVLTRNPDVIFNTASSDSWKQSWQPWPEIAAVRTHRLYSLNADWISRPGPRLTLGVRQICAALS